MIRIEICETAQETVPLHANLNFMYALSTAVIIGIIVGYFLVLMVISWWTSRDADNETFFLANRQSPWPLVAFGMIGATLSGVTFISIPGVVGAGGKNMDFSYMQMVLGYLVGYAVIALVLLPLYYRLQLTSIYQYLEQRLGFYSYKTGAGYFLLSRIIGASFRLYLVAMVLQLFLMDRLGIPFGVTVLVTIALIYVYTFQAGIKTIVWTDTLQTTFILTALILTIYYIGQSMNLNVGEMVDLVQKSEYSDMFFFTGGWEDPNNFFKQFISGAFMAIVMTGLDQDMMQKNLTCRTLGESQKNMATFSIILVFANILFLFLGALLYIYAAQIGLEVPVKTDQLYPTIALYHLPAAAGIFFLIGLIAAAYSSADSALTALTTSFCIDFLDFEKGERTEEQKKAIRWRVHIVISLILAVIIFLFHTINRQDVITTLFQAAGYTYGPLLGMFAFGIFTNKSVNDRYVLPICLIAPIISYILAVNQLFIGFDLGFLIILLNGGLTFIGLYLISED